MYEETLGSRLWFYAKLAALAYAVWLAFSTIAPAYSQAWKTHKLIAQIAKEKGAGSSASIAEIRREFSDRAASAGAFADADIAVLRETGELILEASFSVDRRFAACCRLQFDFDLASNQAPFKSLFGGG